MADNLAAIRAAVTAGAALAESFMVCTGKFYEDGNSTLLFETPGRLKIPRPAAFDASNSAQWERKRTIVFSIPMDSPGVPNIIQKGLILQITGADDPALNNTNFTVQSELTATFAATREILCATEGNFAPRIP